MSAIIALKETIINIIDNIDDIQLLLEWDDLEESGTRKQLIKFLKKIKNEDDNIQILYNELQEMKDNVEIYLFLDLLSFDDVTSLFKKALENDDKKLCLAIFENSYLPMPSR